MGPFRGPYRGSPLRDPCWWAVTTEVAAHWEEVLMGPFRGGTHTYAGTDTRGILSKSLAQAYLLQATRVICLFSKRSNFMGQL